VSTVSSYENQIPTGDAPLSGSLYYTFRVPNALWFISAILAQLIDLNSPGAWAYVGEITPDEAAEAAAEVYASIMQVFPIGTILPLAGTIPSGSNLLPCNGASYLRAAYPELFAAIGTTWGAPDGSHFNVPDLRGRALIGDGTGSGLSERILGDELGEETHQLTVAELASHAHSEGTTVPLPVVVVPADGVAAVGAAGTTGSTGGDVAHNNMQPSAVVVWGIVAQ
jgi:microcystin-dependent protein